MIAEQTRRRLHIADAADLEGVLGGRTEVIQVGAGLFEASAEQLHDGAVTVTSISAKRGVQVRRWIGAGRLALAYLGDGSSASEHGRAWNPDRLLFASAAEVDVSSLAPIRTTWIEIDLQRLSDRADRDLLAELRGRSELIPMRGLPPAGEEIAEDEILRRLRAAAPAAQGFGARARSQRRDAALVRRAEQFMWQNAEEPITLERICASIGCGMRSLMYAFKAWFGVGPIRYLKILRLNAVHRRLKETRGETRIFDVAADYGFWHMGHFTTDYKRMFGETASQTVQRARSAGGTAGARIGTALRLTDRQ